MDYDYKKLVPMFDIINIHMASLASEAAIDIDNYRQGIGHENESVQYLSKLLNGITQGDHLRVSLPVIGIVLGYAISGREHFKEYWEGKKFGDIVLQTNLVSKELRDFRSLSEERQEALRDFCLRLSEEATSYRNHLSASWLYGSHLHVA